MTADAWRHDLLQSKYCLVIRGDTPGSRALFRAIRAGCLPVIVSDALWAYAPLFPSWLQPHWQQLALVVPEADFLRLGAMASLEQALAACSPTVLQAKLQALALVQRILVLDHPATSLMVPALVREIVASQTDPHYFDG